MASSTDLIGSVRDPLLDRPLAELDMVAGVEERSRGRKKVTLRLPVPNYPEREELDRRVRAALDNGQVEIAVTVMGDMERTSLMTRLRDGAGPRAGQAGTCGSNDRSPARHLAVGRDGWFRADDCRWTVDEARSAGTARSCRPLPSGAGVHLARRPDRADAESASSGG